MIETEPQDTGQGIVNRISGIMIPVLIPKRDRLRAAFVLSSFLSRISGGRLGFDLRRLGRSGEWALELHDSIFAGEHYIES